MINDDWVNNNTSVQVLLDTEAGISNAISNHKIQGKAATELKIIRATVIKQIECLRGPAPPCYGEDDCSTAILSTCPWRMTCGS